MMTQGKMSQKKKTAYTIGILVVLIVTGVLLWMMYAPVSDQEQAGAIAPILPAVNQNIDLSILENSSVSDLKQYGPQEVEVNLRGSKQNPFQSF